MSLTHRWIGRILTLTQSKLNLASIELEPFYILPTFISSQRECQGVTGLLVHRVSNDGYDSEEQCEAFA